MVWCRMVELFGKLVFMGKKIYYKDLWLDNMIFSICMCWLGNVIGVLIIIKSCIEF